jgi:hypothetical protein
MQLRLTRRDQSGYLTGARRVEYINTIVVKSL